MELTEKEVSLLATALSSATSNWVTMVQEAEASGENHPLFEVMRAQIEEARALLEKIEYAEQVRVVPSIADAVARSLRG